MVFYLSELNDSGSISWREREELCENDWTRFIQGDGSLIILQWKHLKKKKDLLYK